jgi:hypothetical protein
LIDFRAQVKTNEPWIGAGKRRIKNGIPGTGEHLVPLETHEKTKSYEIRAFYCYGLRIEK